MNDKIQRVISDALKNMTEIADANMIVGSPIISTDGSTVIPITKITVGFLSGGGEYGEVKAFSKADYPFSGAGGGMVSVKPSGFLVQRGDKVKFVHCPSDVFEKAFDTCEELVKNINEKSSKN